MRFRGPCAALLLVFAAASLPSSPATAQTFSTFDDFSSADIDGSRWFGYAHTVRFADLVQLADGWNNEAENPATRHPDFSTYNVTSQRRVIGGQLQLQLDSIGGTHPDADVAPGHGRIGVRGRRGSGGAVQARVIPRAADAPGCRADGESRVRAQLVADILAGNPDGSGPYGAFATLSLDRSSFGGDRIYAVVSQCRDLECSVAEDVDWVIFNRAWTLGAAHSLTIRHDRANNRVVFTVTGGGLVSESRVLRAPPPSEGAVATTGFGLRVETTPANCPATSTAPAQRIGVTMDARFDNVRIGAP